MSSITCNTFMPCHWAKSGAQISMSFDEILQDLGFDNINDDLCTNALEENFTSYDFPQKWKFDSTLLGLEIPLKDLYLHLQEVTPAIWKDLTPSDISKLQYVTHITVESCLRKDGGFLTGLYCGTCYVTICSIEGSHVRNVYHNLLLIKVLELLRLVDEVTLFPVIKLLFDALYKLIKSDIILGDQCQWLLIKSVLSSMDNIVCKKSDNKENTILPTITSILESKKNLKFFIKELFPYTINGKCYVGDICIQSLCNIYRKYYDNNHVRECLILFLQHLMVGVSDRTETRRQTEMYILEILKVLQTEDIYILVDWTINNFSASIRVVHRIFCLELCFQLCFNSIITKNIEHIKKLSVVIGKKMNDKAPTVRAKSLIVLGDLLKSDYEYLGKSVYIYLKSKTEIYIDNSLSQLSIDKKPAVRKACCGVISELLRNVSLKSEWLTILYRFTLDTAVSVRKQALLKIISLFKSNPQSKIIQRMWIESVLPMATDNETSVKTIVAEMLREILDDIGDNIHRPILQLIINPKSIDLQVYFTMGLEMLQITGYVASLKTRKTIVSNLKSQSKDRLISMFLLSKLSRKEHDLVNVSQLLELCQSTFHDDKDAGYQFLLYILESCSNIIKSKEPLDPDAVAALKDFISHQLSQFQNPITVVQAMFSVLHGLKMAGTSCTDLYTSILEQVCKKLEAVCLASNEDIQLSSNQLTLYLCYIGELALCGEAAFSERIVLSIKEVMIKRDGALRFPLQARGQAVLTLGKICLFDERVARSSAVMFSRLLESEHAPEIKNNAMLVLADLTVCYPTLVVDYLYLVTDCLRDKDVTVRRQAILVVTRLLQEEYVKWRSGVIMKFISNLVDDNPNIRMLCELCLTNVLLVRHPRTYFEFFIECVYFINGLEKLTSMNDLRLQMFALPGEDNMGKRHHIYSKMINSLDDRQKLDMMARICREVLGMFTLDTDDDIEDEMEPLLKDALWILCSPAIKLSSLKVKVSDDFDDDDSNINVMQAQTKAISNIVKQNFVENCTSIILSLRNRLQKLKSPLQRDLDKFIVTFAKDYKDEVEAIFGSDSQLVSEVEYGLALEEQNEQDGGFEITAHQSVVPAFLKGFQTPRNLASDDCKLNGSIYSFFNSPFFVPPTPMSSRILQPFSKHNLNRSTLELEFRSPTVSFKTETPMRSNKKSLSPRRKSISRVLPSKDDEINHLEVTGINSQNMNRNCQAEVPKGSSKRSNKRLRGKGVKSAKQLFNPEITTPLSITPSVSGSASIPLKNLKPQVVLIKAVMKKNVPNQSQLTFDEIVTKRSKVMEKRRISNQEDVSPHGTNTYNNQRPSTRPIDNSKEAHVPCVDITEFIKKTAAQRKLHVYNKMGQSKSDQAMFTAGNTEVNDLRKIELRKDIKLISTAMISSERNIVNTDYKTAEQDNSSTNMNKLDFNQNTKIETSTAEDNIFQGNVTSKREKFVAADSEIQTNFAPKENLSVSKENTGTHSIDIMKYIKKAAKFKKMQENDNATLSNKEKVQENDNATSSNKEKAGKSPFPTQRLQACSLPSSEIKEDDPGQTNVNTMNSDQNTTSLKHLTQENVRQEKGTNIPQHVEATYSTAEINASSNENLHHNKEKAITHFNLRKYIMRAALRTRVQSDNNNEPSNQATKPPLEAEAPPLKQSEVSSSAETVLKKHEEVEASAINSSAESCYNNREKEKVIAKSSGGATRNSLSQEKLGRRTSKRKRDSDSAPALPSDAYAKEKAFVCKEKTSAQINLAKYIKKAAARTKIEKTEGPSTAVQNAVRPSRKRSINDFRKKGHMIFDPKQTVTSTPCPRSKVRDCSQKTQVSSTPAHPTKLDLPEINLSPVRNRKT